MNRSNKISGSHGWGEESRFIEPRLRASEDLLSLLSKLSVINEDKRSYASSRSYRMAYRYWQYLQWCKVDKAIVKW